MNNKNTHVPVLSDKLLAEYKEIVSDSLNSAHKFSIWELDFLFNMQRGLATHGAFFDPSDKQIACLRKIEAKLHKI